MELWDLYDRDKKPLHKVVIRSANVAIPKGMYHIVVECIILDKEERILMTKRAPEKHHALMWECTAGSIVAGETSVEGCIREVEEETGLKLKAEQLTLIRTEVTDIVIRDTYVACVETIDATKIRLQATETVDATAIPVLDFQRYIFDRTDLNAEFVYPQYNRIMSVIGTALRICRETFHTEEQVAEAKVTHKAIPDGIKKKKTSAPATGDLKIKRTIPVFEMPIRKDASEPTEEVSATEVPPAIDTGGDLNG